MRLLALALPFVLGCAATPDPAESSETAESEPAPGGCRTVYGESAIHIDCAPQDAWTEEAVEEAEEGFEERGPERRP